MTPELTPNLTIPTTPPEATPPTPSTPEPTQTTAELRAEVIANEEQSHAEAALSGYNVEELADGRFRVAYDTGSVYEGSQREVLDKIAKQGSHAAAHIKELRAKVKQYEQTPQQQQPASIDAVQQQPPATSQQAATVTEFIDPAIAALNPDDPNDAVLLWQINMNDKAEALRYGVTVPELRQARMANAIQTEEVKFHQKCPDFPNTQEAWKVLTDIAAPDFIGPNGFKRLPRAEDLERAHAIALYRKMYSPISLAPTPARPNPSPMLTTTAPVPTQGFSDTDLYSMPMDKLKELAQRGR